MNTPGFNQLFYRKKSLRTFGPKLWNSLPYINKYSKNLESFKKTKQKQLSTGVGNVASIRFVIAVNK